MSLAPRGYLIAGSCQPTTLLLPYPFLSIRHYTKSLSSHHLCSSSSKSRKSSRSSSTTPKITMAAASVTVSPATFTVASATVGGTKRRKRNVHYITGLNAFDGLKAQNSVTSLGLPVCTERSFAKVVSSLKSPSRGKGKGGGALSSTCNAADEIFRIAAIVNGLVLIGVAVGFVLLRIEASVEEAD